MAVLRASPPPFLPEPLSRRSHSQPNRRSTTSRGAAATARLCPAPCVRSRSGGAKKGLRCLPATEAGVGSAGVAREEGGDDNGEEYLAREAGWGVRAMARVGEEMRRVAQVQAEAFHVPVALLDDFFFDLFKMLGLVNSALLRFAFLVAEEAEPADQQSKAPYESIVGVLDCTVQDEDNVLKQLQGVDEYLYVSGIAVSPTFSRRKIGIALLKAYDALGLKWRHRFMVLRAYEDDEGARGLYAKAGYRVMSRDPDWVIWVGRRRVVMIKELPVHDIQIEQQRWQHLTCIFAQ